MTDQLHGMALVLAKCREFADMKGSPEAVTDDLIAAIDQMTEKGLMANADVAGTKYWKNDKLN